MQFTDLSIPDTGQNNWRILLVDDDEDDYILIRDMLQKAQEGRFRLEWASSFQAGRDALSEGGFDAVLMNYDLGAHTGFELIGEAIQNQYHAPILLLSGRGHPEADIAALRAGAADYLHKDDLTPRFLERSIRYAIERRQTEEALRLSETRFNKAFHTMPDALVISRLDDGLIYEVNDSFVRLFGFSQAELAGKTSLDLHMFANPEDRKKAIERLRADQRVVDFEIDIQTKSGDVRQASLSIEIMPIHDEVCLLTIIRDITEQKQTVTALRLAHEQATWLARFPDENPNPVARVASDGIVLYHNSAAAALPGWELQVGKLLPDDLLLIIRNYIEQGHWAQEDVPIAGRYYSITVMPFPLEGYVNLYCVDITERKQAEERLAYQARLLELVHDTIIATDDQMKIVYWNRAAEQLYGWSQAEAVGQNAALLLRSGLEGEERERVLQQTHEAGVYQGEIIHHTKDDRRLVIETRTLVQKDPGGQVVGYISANRDVTSRRQVEEELRKSIEALRESEQKFSIIFDQSAFAAGLSKLSNGVLVNANAAFEKLFGYTRQEMIGKTSLELGTLPDGEVRARLLAQLQEHGSVHDQEMHLRTKSGELRDFIANIDVIAIGEEQFILNTMIDITERKRLEAEQRRLTAAIQQERDRLSALINSITDEIWFADADQKVTLVNPAVWKEFGEGVSEVKEVEKIAASFEVYRADGTPRPVREAPPLRALQGETVANEEEIVRTPASGELRYRQVNAAPVRGPDGSIIGSVSVVRDITERKQAEEALEKALTDVENERNRLLAMMEALPIGVVIVDGQGGIVQANQEYQRIWGGPYPTTQSVDDYGAFKAWWVDTGEPVQSEEWASAQAVQRGETVKGQLVEIQRFDGTRGIVLNSGAPVRDAQGQIIGCAVGIMDITEQKRLEAEQQEHRVQMEIQRRLLDYRDQERQAMARELHDGPVQDLSSLLFNVQFAKEAITDLGMKSELDNIALRLRSTVQDLREMINEMRPPSLIRFGLAKAMNVFLEEFREKHPEMILDTSLMDDGSCLSEQARLGLYRILQEALTNTTKHSQANRISVVLSCEDHQTVLEIRDNGKGFTQSDNLIEYSLQGHFGLVGMKERAQAIGGTFEINSTPEKGTTIRVVVPLG